MDTKIIKPMCSSCTHMTMKERDNTKYSFCELHTFPVHASYSCGKFDQIPEKIKTVIANAVINLPFEMETYHIYFINIDAHIELIENKTKALMITKANRKGEQDLFILPLPRSIVEFIYVLKVTGTKYEIEPAIKAKYDIASEQPEEIISSPEIEDMPLI